MDHQELNIRQFGANASSYLASPVHATGTDLGRLAGIAEAPLLDTSLQVVEFLRDGSHVRDYRISEWRSMQLAAGFTEPVVDGWKLPMDFATWTARIGTPPARVAALRAVLTDLPREVRDYFQVDAGFSFAIDSAWLETTKLT